MFEDLPVGPQWVLNRDDIQSIASDYGLTVATSDARTLSGAINGVVRVASSDGDVVLRVHRPWTTPARLTAIHGLQHSLRLADLPIPRVLPTRTGATWTRLADRLVEVSEYIPSDHSANTWAHSAPAFAMLARLHAALAQVPPGAIPPPAYGSYADPATALAMLAETEDRFVAHTNHPDYQQAATARQATRALLRTLAAERDRYEPLLPRSLVHGDYGGDNVLLRGAQVVAILDFDFLAERERIFDLAYSLYWALHYFCPPHSTALPPAACLTDAAALLRRYQQHTAMPLTTPELPALPYEMARIPLFFLAEAGYLTDEDIPGGPIGQTLRFAHHLPIAEALATNAAQVSLLLAPSSE
jgi:homoserine kinase type II